LEGLTKFTEEELDDLETKFSKVATNGSVTKSEFPKLFHQKYTKLVDDPQIKDYVFAEFDQNGDGTLDFRDYVTSLSTLCRGTPNAKITMLLRIFDKDKRGHLTPEDLTNLMRWQFRSMEFRDTEEMVKTSVDIAFSEFDIDRDGKLSFDEFFWVCHKQPMVVQMLDLVDIEDDV